MHGDINVIVRQIDDYTSMSSSMVPFIGLTYSTLRRSNLAYNHAIDILDSLHESGKGFITVESPRVSGRGTEDPDVSAIHYSSFIVADLAAERVYSGGSSGEPNLRLFEKKDLAVPLLDNRHLSSEHDDELRSLSGDKKLETLLRKMMAGTDNLSNEEKHKSRYLSRIHENIVTSKEYER